MLQELGSLVQLWGHGTMSGPIATIQLGRWTGKPANLVALIPTMGRRAEKTMGVGKAATVYHQPHVQVYVRRTDPEVAESVALDLHDRFDGFQGEVLGTRYFLIEAIQPPWSMGVTENDGLMQYAFNLHVRRKNP